jgi:predicted lipid-binding transport protein (Tim44 family)
LAEEKVEECKGHSQLILNLIIAITSQPNNNTQPNTNNAQPRSGMGAGTAAVLGAAAGAAGGYMLGKSMSNENKQTASGTVSQQAQTATTNNINNAAQNESKIPWGIISILVILLVIGLMFFRKKSRPEFQNSNGFNNNQNNSFNIPNIQKREASPQYNAQNNQDNANQNNSFNDEKMPDGIEKMYFLRQAKGIFLHIQSMNNPENLSEIVKYLTPDLYNEIKEDIANNQTIADFPVLNCNLISANIENNQLVASVSFNGVVSESPDQPSQPFFEIWNFVKTDLNTNKWLVAGIQQNPQATNNA